MINWGNTCVCSCCLFCRRFFFSRWAGPSSRFWYCWFFFLSLGGGGGFWGVGNECLLIVDGLSRCMYWRVFFFLISSAAVHALIVFLTFGFGG